MTSPDINLGQLVGSDHKYELSLSNENPEDAQARRVQEAADAALNRVIKLSLFIFALALTTIVFAGCIYVFAIGNPEDKKWAAGIISAISSGLVGFPSTILWDLLQFLLPF